MPSIKSTQRISDDHTIASKLDPAERNAIKSTTNNGVTRNQRTKRSKQGNPKAVSSSATLDFSRVAVGSKQRNPKAVLSSRQR